MNDRELLEKIAEEIKDAGKALYEYDGYKDKRGSDYDDGWNDAIDQIVLELLGRKGQDGAKLLDQAIKGKPTATKEMVEGGN